MKKLICPVCEDEKIVEKSAIETVVKVRGEEIKVPSNLYKCLDCGYDQIEDMDNQIDELESAYREYRKKYNMMQPEEIKKYRKEYGLTQQELATLFGWSVATINRYEKGALQDTAHETFLMMLKHPEFIAKLLEKNKSKFDEKKYNKIKKNINNKIAESSIKSEFDKLSYNYNSKEDSKRGYKEFTVEKLVDFVKFVLLKAKKMAVVVNKTKFNKFLFYSDFFHCQNYGVSISGMTYAKLPYGPCPENFQDIIALLEKNKIINIEEVLHDNDICEERIKLSENLDFDFKNLTNDEINTISNILENLGNKKARELSEISHQEKAYELTDDFEIIDYEFAKYLKNIN